MNGERLRMACPAAHEVNPPGLGMAVVCGVIERENRDESGPQINPLVPMSTDWHSVVSYCTAAAPLASDRRDAFAASGYTACPVWRAECSRRTAGERRIAVDDNYGGRG